jgi:hypothetical protein
MSRQGGGATDGRFRMVPKARLLVMFVFSLCVEQGASRALCVRLREDV